MMNEHKYVLAILKACLRLEHKAQKLYMAFAAEHDDVPDLKARWLEIADDEREHIDFWRSALEQCSKGKFQVNIDSPADVLEKICEIDERSGNIIQQFTAYGNTAEELMLAYIFEAYMLDPCFIGIFRTFGFLHENMEAVYGQHLQKFVDIRKTHCHDKISLHIDILGDILLKLYRLNNELSHESFTDPLTNMLNRRGFFNTISPFLNLAARNRKNIGIIIADIDNFKKLNDTYGHSAGDKALKTAAFIIESSLRKSDISGRYGGEEFIVFTYNTQPEDLHSLCERIRANIENNSENLCGNAFTISLGAAAGNIEDPSPDALMELIDIADENLYQAKTNGKNTYVIS
jgi:diguanylate cyclase (GGDEF)-like protein